MYSIKDDNKCTYKEFLNPDFVYIPFTINDKLLIKNNNIKKCSILFNNSKFNTTSPISGTITKRLNDLCINDKLINCIEIKNDFMEQTKTRKGVIKNLNNYSKEEIIKILSDNDICNIGKINNNLVISLVDIDPFEHTLQIIFSKKMIEILDTIDLIVKKFEFDNAYIIALNSDELNVTNLINNLGSYPNIKLKLLPNLYPIGFKEIMLDYLKIKDVEFYTVEDMLNIYNALRCKKNIIEKYITVGGNALKENNVLLLKIGTKLDDLIDYLEFKSKKYDVLYNGLINGNKINNKNNIIDKNVRSIFFNSVDKSKTKKCINCGLCNSKCPQGLNPKKTLKNKNEKINCINCGLCTYICPSKINFKPFIGGNHE